MSQVVAVVRGGYGGTLVAKALDAEAAVVLIDPRDAFVNVAGSLRALTRPDWAHNLFFPYRTLLERGRVVRESAASVDAGGVTLAGGGRVDADYIVLATGSAYSHPARPRRAAARTEEALGTARDSRTASRPPGVVENRRAQLRAIRLMYGSRKTEPPLAFDIRDRLGEWLHDGDFAAAHVRGCLVRGRRVRLDGARASVPS